MGDTVTVTWAAATAVGRIREQNEDAHFANLRADIVPPRGLFIVCDGMGGHARGEEASVLAVSVLREQLARFVDKEWPDVDVVAALREAVLANNRAIFARNEEAGRLGKERAGTTVALLLIAPPAGYVVHVGDSRVYQVTSTGARLLTTDHNVGNREVCRGVAPAEAWSRVDARHLTRALGPSPDDRVEPDIGFVRITEECLFLLCTDGLSDREFVERHERQLLRPLLAADVDLARGCRTLLEVGNQVNGHDNLTAVLVRVTGFGAAMAAPDVTCTKASMPHGSGTMRWLARLLEPRRRSR